MTVLKMENAILVFVIRFHVQIVLKGGNVFRENAILRNASMPGIVHIKWFAKTIHALVTLTPLSAKVQVNVIQDKFAWMVCAKGQKSVANANYVLKDKSA